MKNIAKLAVLIGTLSVVNSCKYTAAPAGGLSKEMCSCLFISEQSEDYCRSVTKESRILARYDIDYNRKEVWARGSDYRALAKLDANPRFGCSIQVIEIDPEAKKRREEQERRRSDR